MRCDGCGLEQIVTVVTTIKMQRIDPRSGRETTETRTTRLCVKCGGAEEVER